MPPDASGLPDDLAAAHAMILAERAARLEAEARADRALAEARLRALEIERLKLLLAKARREQYGRSSERGAKLVEQLELQLADLEETAAEEVAAFEIAAPAREWEGSIRGTRKPARRPFPAHLPRERVVYPAPCCCPKCGGPVRKLGEDLTETLECVPRRWKVVEHVREKVSCRTCEAISQPRPAGRGSIRAAGAVRRPRRATGPLAPDRPREGRPQSPRADLGRQVRPAPAADQAEHDLRPRGCRP